MILTSWPAPGYWIFSKPHISFSALTSVSTYNPPTPKTLSKERKTFRLLALQYLSMGFRKLGIFSSSKVTLTLLDSLPSLGPFSQLLLSWSWLQHIWSYVTQADSGCSWASVSLLGSSGVWNEFSCKLHGSCGGWHHLGAPVPHSSALVEFDLLPIYLRHPSNSCFHSERWHWSRAHFGSNNSWQCWAFFLYFGSVHLLPLPMP
jgi:hypothetical protein